MRQIEFEWPELEVTVTANLADDKNPGKCNVLWDNLPIESIQGHSFSSGDRMYAPCRIINDIADDWIDPRSGNPKIGHWEEKYWGRVPVEPGLVLASFGASFTWIDIVYGQLREALPIPPIAYVIDEDLDLLANVGHAVWEGLMAQMGYKVIIRRADGSEKQQDDKAEEEKKDSISWKVTKHNIETILDQIYLEMPLEVKKLKAGILPHNAGHHGQYLSALESLMMTLMGWCFYSNGMIMKTINDPTFTLEQCQKLITEGNRNPARYTGYIAYPMVWNLWLELEAALSTIENKEELKELMIPWFSFINRMHHWNVQVFPWSLSKNVQTKTVAEIETKKYFTGKVAVHRSPSNPEK